MADRNRNAYGVARRVRPPEFHAGLAAGAKKFGEGLKRAVIGINQTAAEYFKR